MIPTSLVSDLKQRRVILFVGAGVSMNLGLPSFKALVAQIGKDLGFDPDIFLSLGDYPSLAEYYLLERGSLGDLRSWMDTTLPTPARCDLSFERARTKDPCHEREIGSVAERVAATQGP